MPGPIHTSGPDYHAALFILSRYALEQEGIARFEERTMAGFGIGQILLLKIRKVLRFKSCDSAFVLHVIFLSSLTF